MRRTPTPEEELILLLCGTAKHRRQHNARVGTLAREVDYDALAALMARQLILPLLGQRLVAAAPGQAPPRFLDLLDKTTVAARRRGVALEMLGTQVQSDLRADGVEALPLKGTVLSRILYRDPGIRLAKDIDILVGADQLDRAAAALVHRGYHRAEAPGEGRPQLHLSLAHERPELPPVEVHWRVHWYEESFSQRMLRRSRRVPEGLRAQPADELASLLLFFSRDGLTGLRLAVDVSAWWDIYGASEEAPPLDRIAREAPELRPALTAAAVTLERLVGTPADAMISAGQRCRSRRSLAATRLANWTVTGEWDQINANLTLVDLLLSPRGGAWSFAKRSLFPPGTAIAKMYRLPSSAFWRLAFWRLAHAPKLLTRYLIAFWRVRGGREWVALPKSSGAIRPEAV